MNHQRWKRPDSIPYPSIWSKFNGRKPINGTVPKFWVQDIPEDQFEDVVDFMSVGFLRDEPLCRTTNLQNEKASVEDFRGLWRHLLRDKLGLICYVENEDSNDKPIIAGVNCVHIIRKDDPNFHPKGLKSIKIFDSLKFLFKKKDFFKELNVDSYLNGLGLSVAPEFRGQGIGLELLKAREPLCRAVGIKVTLTAFSAIESQSLAEKLGYKDFIAISYEDLRRENPEFNYPGIEKEVDKLRYMYLSFV